MARQWRRDSSESPPEEIARGVFRRAGATESAGRLARSLSLPVCARASGAFLATRFAEPAGWPHRISDGFASEFDGMGFYGTCLAPGRLSQSRFRQFALRRGLDRAARYRSGLRSVRIRSGIA